MTNVKSKKLVINVNLRIILLKFVQNMKKNQKIKKLDCFHSNSTIKK